MTWLGAAPSADAPGLRRADWGERGITRVRSVRTLRYHWEMTRVATLVCCLAASLWAQYPPETHWRRIRTEHFEVVYPSEIEAAAQRAANALETMYAPLSR